ncbi:MAG TPA: MFS transporter [Acidimicrobiaceae bacterium]|nr:MFS transporter [Acidimicrobiaceae bacterium]
MVHATKVEPFRGWGLLGLSTLAISLTLPGQTIGVSSFADHLTTDLAISATSLSTAYLIGTISGSLAMPTIGRWIDRTGVRKTMILIATAFSIAVAYMGTVRHLWMLVIGFVGIRMLGQGALSLVGQTSIALWFDQKRGLAFGLSMTASAGLMSLGPLGLTSLIDSFGWRWAWVISAVCIFLILVPATWRWMEDRPESLGQRPDGRAFQHDDAVIEIDQYTVREAAATNAFWVLTGVTVVSSALITGVTFHHFALMEAAGLTTGEAAAVFVPQMVGTVAAGFIWAWLTDRVSAKFLLISCQASLLGAHLSYAWVSPGIGAALYSLLLGANGGSIRALASALYPKWFGTENIGAIRGLATAFGVGASAIGPLIVALGFRATGDYVSLNYFLALVPAVAIFASFLLRVPKKSSSDHEPTA